jgi:hypothetical protein
MAVHRKHFGKKPFVSASYHHTYQDSRLRPTPISFCPESLNGHQKCEIKDRGWYSRKTGPEIQLKICRCLVHDISFSIYPPGYGPYERRAIMPISYNGNPIDFDLDFEDARDESHEDSEVVETPMSQPRGQHLQQPEAPKPQDSNRPIIIALRESSFIALIDFLWGFTWPQKMTKRNSDVLDEMGRPPPGVYRTQVRHIKRLSYLLGITPYEDDDFRLETYRFLGIPAGDLIDSAVRIREGPMLKTLASEGGKNLEKILSLPQNLLIQGLIKQGENIGLWGAPLQQ